VSNRPLRTRALAAFGVILASAAVAAFGVPAGEGHACSLVGFGHQVLPFAMESSSVVAVGRLVEAKRDVITLVVEEGMKGAAPGERLTVNNAQLGLGADCTVYVERGQQGFALPEEARVIAFLQANDLGGSAELRSALHGFGVFPLEGDYIRQDRSVGFRAASFSDAEHAIESLASDPTDLDLEKVGPCNPRLYPADDATLARNVRMSSLIAVGTYRLVGGGVAELTVDDVLRGDAGGAKTLRINAHHFYNDNSCRATMESGAASYAVEFQAIVFLRPDDYGVTDWRGAIWGSGVLAVVGGELQFAPGMPTLDQIRMAASDAGFGPQSPGFRAGGQAGTPGQVDPRGPDGPGFNRARLGIAAASLLIVAAIGLAAARRRWR
jgi:hypothetical protein